MSAIYIRYRGVSYAPFAFSRMMGIPATTTYRLAKHVSCKTGKSFVSGAAVIKQHKKRQREREDSLVIRCQKKEKNYRRVLYRLHSGMPIIEAMNNTNDSRGKSTQHTCKLTASEVIAIYVKLFKREKTQASLAKTYQISATAVSDIWTGRRWGWLTAPIRFELEEQSEASNERH